MKSFVADLFWRVFITSMLRLGVMRVCRHGRVEVGCPVCRKD